MALGGEKEESKNGKGEGKQKVPRGRFEQNKKCGEEIKRDENKEADCFGVQDAQNRNFIGHLHAGRMRDNPPKIESVKGKPGKEVVIDGHQIQNLFHVTGKKKRQGDDGKSQSGNTQRLGQYFKIKKARDEKEKQRNIDNILEFHKDADRKDGGSRKRFFIKK